MREIIFRGKRCDNDMWVEGFYCCLYDSKGNESCRIYPGYAETDCGDFYPDWFGVDPETVGQYTGLKDKNGKKIFEGDIVRYGDTVHKVVFEQRNGTAYFGLVYSSIETFPFDYYQDLKQIEVIGNIHENPELLERGDDNGE